MNPGRSSTDGAGPRIVLAGGIVRHTPWFGAGGPPSAGAEAPSGAAADMTNQTISSLLRGAACEAYARPVAERTATSSAALLLAAPRTTLRTYVRGAWRDGTRGFLLACLHGFVSFMIVVRAWQEREMGRAPRAAQ